MMVRRTLRGMYMKKLTLALSMAAIATSALAGGFDGPFVQLGVGGSDTKTNESGVSSYATPASNNGNHSQGSVNGLVAVGYSQDFGIFNPSLKGFNLAANLFYVIGNQAAGNPNSSGNGIWMGAPISNNISTSNKLQNTFGISIEPGWNFTESTLGFVKLAWVTSQSKNNVSYSDSLPDAYQINNNKQINGFGYGLGVKQLLTDHIFLGVDLMGVTYGKATYSGVADGTPYNASFKASQFMGFASIGYKF